MNGIIVAHPSHRPPPAAAETPPAAVTHEAFIHAVRCVVLARIDDDTQRARLADAKLVYGAGHGMGARGVTFYGAWANGTPGHDFLEVCAAGEETTVQIRRHHRPRVGALPGRQHRRARHGVEGGVQGPGARPCGGRRAVVRAGALRP
jgi:hypothetical protein